MSLYQKGISRVKLKLSYERKINYQKIIWSPTQKSTKNSGAKKEQDQLKKNNCPINHAYKIYSLTIKDSIKEVSSTSSDNMMMLIRMNDSTRDIIKTMTRYIFFNNKSTSTIGVSRPYQLVQHLSDVVFIHQRISKRQVRKIEILKLKKDEGK